MLVFNNNYCTYIHCGIMGYAYTAHTLLKYF